MHTLAHANFAEFDEVPAVDKLEVKPIGALILAIQAVQFQSFNFSSNSGLMFCRLNMHSSPGPPACMSRPRLRRDSSQGIIMVTRSQRKRKRWTHQACKQPPGNAVSTYDRGVRGSPLGEYFGGSEEDFK